MRIVQETRQRLHVRHRPWFAWAAMALLVGSAFWSFAFKDLDPIDWALYIPVVVGIISLTWWGMPAVDLIFDRKEGCLIFEERRFTGLFRRSYPLTEIRRVSVRYERHRNMTPRLNRLFLETATGEVALERGFGPYDRKGVAIIINRWLEPALPADPEP